MRTPRPLEKAARIPGVIVVSDPFRAGTVSAAKTIGYADALFREQGANVPESARDGLQAAVTPARAAGLRVAFGGTAFASQAGSSAASVPTAVLRAAWVVMPWRLSPVQRWAWLARAGGVVAGEQPSGRSGEAGQGGGRCGPAGELAEEGAEAGRQQELVAVMAQPGLTVGMGDVVAGEIGDAAERQPVDEHECAGSSQVQRHAVVVQAGTSSGISSTMRRGICLCPWSINSTPRDAHQARNGPES